MSEEEVIKRRLIFDGDGTGDDRRFNLMLKMITKWIHSIDESPEESRQMYDKILAQLSLVEHSRRRSELVTKSNDEQLMKYQKLYYNYEEKIKEVRSEISNQRSELEKAKRGLLLQNPPRTEMNRQLIMLQKELMELGEEKKRLVQKLDKRKKQFHVLFTSANQLKVYLDEEDDSEINTSLDDVTANSPGPEPMSE
ncbi:hypothetical protein NQ317_015486 [Molorchus minor]|uniref:THO complex subunit 7 homolog n=1 Tax=Molorchus minor TaxID=1323400 RepID=A0ABQ9J891_9CUCU|nr:hypothetical protein NQ317_015486 [Molorchus minor]